MGIGKLAQFCHAFHQLGDLFIKFPCDIFFCVKGILHHIMENSCHDRLLVQFQLRQNDGDTQGMDDIGLPGLSLLVLMGSIRQSVSLFNHTDVCRRMVIMNRLNQFVIQHLGIGKILGMTDLSLGPDYILFKSIHANHHFSRIIFSLICSLLFPSFQAQLPVQLQGQQAFLCHLKPILCLSSINKNNCTPKQTTLQEMDIKPSHDIHFHETLLKIIKINLKSTSCCSRSLFTPAQISSSHICFCGPHSRHSGRSDSPGLSA